MRAMLLALTLIAAPGLLAAQEATDAARQAEVRAVVRAFHEALATGDSLAAIERLHVDVSIFEGGRAETLDHYRSGHLRGDIAFASATRREVIGDAVSILGDQALYTAESHTTGELRGREIDSRGTETMVLVRTPEGWRIRHVHWSSR